MHKKNSKIFTGCRVSEAKIYIYHSTEIAKARPHSEEWERDTSVQKQWSMARQMRDDGHQRRKIKTRNARQWRHSTAMASCQYFFGGEYYLIQLHRQIIHQNARNCFFTSLSNYLAIFLGTLSGNAIWSRFSPNQGFISCVYRGLEKTKRDPI